MNMLYTSRQPGFNARLISSYQNTTGKCVELYYWIDSEYKASTLSVKTVDEELFETTMSTASLVVGDWRRMFARLPDGSNRVVVEGTRDASGGCQISIDDIMIQHCIQFGTNEFSLTENAQSEL